jgi:hypothetical protein
MVNTPETSQVLANRVPDVSHLTARQRRNLTFWTDLKPR